VLRGDAGIGKTRLAGKFLAWARAQGAELLHGDAFESGSHFPFQPLVDAIRLRLEADEAFKGLLDDVWLPSLSQLMPEFRQSQPEQALATLESGSLEAELTQSQLFESLVQLTLALAKQAPLVLFVDDLQWADSATLDLLHFAIRRWKGSVAHPDGARILLFVTLRTEALLPVTQPQRAGGSPGLIQWLTRVEREITPIYLELELLGKLETEQMVNLILSPPSPDFSRWLYEETHGHPYYLIETLKDLLERRVLRPKRQAEGQWTFAVHAEQDLGQATRVPSTVHAVIRSRLNRLSPNAFSVLAGAAVLEQPLTFEHLLAISNINEDIALPALDELISGRLLLESGEPGVANEYAFVNDMLRDVVYTEAGEARRRLFHRRALEILNAEGDSSAALAHHALAAGLPQEAFRHSLAAGREALRLSAVNEATIHLERAFQLVREGSLPEIPDKTTMRDLYRRLRRAYELSGQAEKALAIEAELDRIV
jgi:predicted ATPase